MILSSPSATLFLAAHHACLVYHHYLIALSAPRLSRLMLINFCCARCRTRHLRVSATHTFSFSSLSPMSPPLWTTILIADEWAATTLLLLHRWHTIDASARGHLQQRPAAGLFENGSRSAAPLDDNYFITSLMIIIHCAVYIFPHCQMPTMMPRCRRHRPFTLRTRDMRAYQHADIDDYRRRPLRKADRRKALSAAISLLPSQRPPSPSRRKTRRVIAPQ